VEATAVLSIILDLSGLTFMNSTGEAVVLDIYPAPPGFD
jgi:anti-anti-sigma regulatory factor